LCNFFLIFKINLNIQESVVEILERTRGILMVCCSQNHFSTTKILNLFWNIINKNLGISLTKILNLFWNIINKNLGISLTKILNIFWNIINKNLVFKKQQEGLIQ